MMRPSSYLVARPPFGRHRHRPLAHAAYHETGHVIIGCATGRRLVDATVIAAGDVAGAVRALAEMPEDAPAGVRAFFEMQSGAFSMGGETCERLGTGACAGYERDREHARDEFDEAGRLISTPAPWWEHLVAASVEHYLRSHWPSVERIAELLLDEGIVNGDRLHRLVGEVEPLDLHETTYRIADLAGVKVG